LDLRTHERLNDARHDAITNGLADRGFAVVPGFLARKSVTALRGDGMRRRAAGEFHAASIGRSGTAECDASIRGDSICWLHEGAPTAPERALFAQLEALCVALNGALFLGISEFEAHYACYPPGAGYVRHVDRFRDDAARVISLVLYLNDDWRDTDGGALRIYATRDANTPTCELPPSGGTLVAMRSDTLPHEVLPAITERWSIAGWLRRRPAPQG
jgi:SM-20-related protein